MPGQKATEAERREQILKAAHDVALRRGIDGLTVRAVAARARLSHGLVLFHFKRKDQLGLALLDRVLETTLSLGTPQTIETNSDPQQRFHALLRHEVHRLSEEPRRIRLLLEYWARGAHNTVIRSKISASVGEYRAAFRALAEAVLGGESGRPGWAPPAAVAAAAVSLIIGYPVQLMINSGQFDPEEYLAAVQGIFGQFDKRTIKILSS